MIENLFEKLTAVSRRGFMGKAAAAAAAFVSSLAFPRLAYAGNNPCPQGTNQLHGCCLCKDPTSCTYPSPCASPNYCEWHWVACDKDICKLYDCKECYSVGSPCDGRIDCTGNICSKAVALGPACAPFECQL